MTPSLLVVDDNPDIVYAIDAVVKKERPGLAIDCVDGGDDCLQYLLERGPPDAILLDIMMPGMDGWELLKRLRADPATETIPVVIVSAKGQVVDRKNLDLIGIQGYLQKPFRSDELLEVIDTVLSR